MNLSAPIRVSMADFKVAKAPSQLITTGLGSCVGVALYDPVAKVAGLAHIMLPDSRQGLPAPNQANLLIQPFQLSSPKWKKLAL